MTGNQLTSALDADASKLVGKLDRVLHVKPHPRSRIVWVILIISAIVAMQGYAWHEKSKSKSILGNPWITVEDVQVPHEVQAGSTVDLEVKSQTGNERIKSAIVCLGNAKDPVNVPIIKTDGEVGDLNTYRLSFQVSPDAPKGPVRAWVILIPEDEGLQKAEAPVGVISPTFHVK